MLPGSARFLVLTEGLSPINVKCIIANTEEGVNTRRQSSEALGARIVHERRFRTNCIDLHLQHGQLQVYLPTARKTNTSLQTTSRIHAGGFVGKGFDQGQPFELADLILIHGAEEKTDL
jgi:hypothetical protein